DAQRGAAPADGPVTPYEQPGDEMPAEAGTGQGYDVHAAAGPGAAPSAGTDSTQVYQPMPMHEDSGEYPAYNRQPNYAQDPYAGAGYQGYEATTGYGDWSGEQQHQHQQQPAAAAYDAYGQQQTGGWEQQQPGYGDYAGGYQDPYQGQGQGAPQQQYGYDTPAGGVWVPQQGGEQQPYVPPQQNSYDQQGQGQYDPYRYN
ncbi:hypothetical protein PV392_30925, partial [Streptomyces sp. ME03-5709C]|nr:hypothetical protein [Streptomyces sp. ME03-5709C]